MPLGCVLCMDQSEGPTHPGIDDSCMTVGLRGERALFGIHLDVMVNFFLICPAFLFVFYSSSFSCDLLLPIV